MPPGDLPPRPPAWGRPNTLTASERAELGRAARRAVPRSSHAVCDPPPGRDPVAVLRRQAEDRVPRLIGIRHGRMATSPFAFFRGSAALMADDLAGTPVTGLRVQACGDAHLANFGLFAAPDRRLVFDLNDFDETLPGPWEWDLTRLATSVAVVLHEGDAPPDVVRAGAASTVRAYREAMHVLAASPALGTWYARVDEEALAALARRLGHGASRRVARTSERARRRDSARAFARMATVDADGARIAADPPLVVPLRDIAAPGSEEEVREGVRAMTAAYRASLPDDRRHLFDRFRIADVAHRVVGVGSVGLQAWVVLMLGRAHGEPLFLQLKEARRSVLAPHAGAGPYRHQGRRVVEGQRLMQATGDVLLGWTQATGPDGVRRDFYVRQLWDGKGSINVAGGRRDRLEAYARLCAGTLARAHARSGDAVAIAAYLGGGDRVDRAMAERALTLARRNAEDHAALVAAIAAGDLPAVRE